MGRHSVPPERGISVSYNKFWASVVATVLAAIVPALSAGPLDMLGWFNVIALASGALMVINAENTPGWGYAKTIAAVVSAAAVALMSFWSDGMTSAEWMQVALAVAGALGVYAIPNSATEPVEA